MVKPQSKKAGKSTNGCQVYVAIRPIPCKKCGHLLQTGEHFTRPSLGGRPVTTGPVCRECEAFEEMPACPKCGEIESLWRYGQGAKYKHEFHCNTCGTDFQERKVAA